MLSWRSDVLTEDGTITGDIIANLFAATSGSDSDWVVKLIDVAFNSPAFAFEEPLNRIGERRMFEPMR